MFSRMMKAINASDSLYLSPQQKRDVAEYAKSLPERFAAARAVEKAEGRIVDRALAALRAAHPDLADLAGAGWESAEDDLRLALRAVVQGVLMDDPDVAEATVLDHLRRTLGYLNLPDDAPRDVFAGLRAAAEAALPAEAFALLAPDLDRAVRAAAGDPVTA
jgi:hypothetical protein